MATHSSILAWNKNKNPMDRGTWQALEQSIIMELTSEKSCCSAGNNQVDEQAGITQHRWQLSRR